VDGLKLAALDTLQHVLTRDAKSADCLAHWQESFAGVTVESRLEFVGEPDAPGCSGRDLLASDDAVIDEKMNPVWRAPPSRVRSERRETLMAGARGVAGPVASGEGNPQTECVES
jgi:hypothetical protein